MKKNILLAYFVFAFVVPAESAKMVECGESKGFRFDIEKGQVTTDQDRSRRHFFLAFDESAPKKLSLIWPEGKASNGVKLPRYTRKLIVVSSTTTQLSAVDIDSTGDMVGLYSYYPNENILYFAQHRYQTFPNNPNSLSFYAKCTP